LGTAYPTGLPFTYTFTISDATGKRTATSTVSCFQVPFATNVSPAGNVYGTPTFHWTGINDANARYSVELKDGNNNHIWNNYQVSGTSIAYSGPALTSGATYNYQVGIQGSSACSNGSSFAQDGDGRFTYWAAGSDTSAPTVPAGLNATTSGSTQINLSWTGSADNIGVTGYKVYRNGVLVGSPAGTGYSDNGLSASTTYSYSVAACNAAGNCSAQSAAVSATTQRSGDTSTNPRSDCLFSWAERTYATLFAPAGTVSAKALQYYYRYYSVTNAYLATSSLDNHVYYFGPLSINTPLDVGTLSYWLGTAGCQ
jgi:chitodextrinase